MSGDVVLGEQRSAGPILIRRACLDDIPALVDLEAACWTAPLLGFSEDEIALRIQRFALGQLVLLEGSTIIGSLFTQRIESAELLKDGVAFRSALDLHTDAGSVWQLLSIQIHPNNVGCGFGDILINHALTVAKAVPGVERVVAVTRCRTFGQARMYHSTLSLRAHVDSGMDPGLNFHTGRGAKVLDVIDGWRPEDVDNDGAGILIEYNLSHFELTRASHDKICAKPSPSLEASQHLITEATQLALSMSNLKTVDIDTPLMDAGLDSYMLPAYAEVLRARHISPLYAHPRASPSRSPAPCTLSPRRTPPLVLQQH